VAGSLRDRQKQVARELILQAAADEIVERGLEELSLKEVASRAGVSKRTLYNYFDTRETLLAELGRWSDELTLEMGGFLVPEGLDTLPGMIPAVWRTWAAQGTIHEAALKIAVASSESGRSVGRRKRQQAIARGVEQIRPGLDPEQRDELAALFHALVSAPIYRRLTKEDGLEVGTAADLVAWAVSVLRDAIAGGDAPTRTEDRRG
jgi:AcrR family transcriptional regulator